MADGALRGGMEFAEPMPSPRLSWVPWRIELVAGVAGVETMTPHKKLAIRLVAILAVAAAGVVAVFAFRWELYER
jgi:hypothetical protein